MPNDRKDDSEEDIKKILFQTAIRYLGYRDRFAKEIEIRLKKQIVKRKLKEESQKLIPEVLSKLEKAGLINDSELINTYIKSRQENKLIGPFTIRQKLLQMGANRNQIDLVLNKLVTKESQSLSIDKLIKKKKPNLKDPKSVLKFQRFLIYRGFESGLIREKIALMS